MKYLCNSFQTKRIRDRSVLLVSESKQGPTAAGEKSVAYHYADSKQRHKPNRSQDFPVLLQFSSSWFCGENLPTSIKQLEFFNGNYVGHVNFICMCSDFNSSKVVDLWREVLPIHRDLGWWVARPSSGIAPLLGASWCQTGCCVGIANWMAQTLHSSFHFIALSDTQ